MGATAVVLQQDNAVAKPAASLSRVELLSRYRRFREIGKQHHSAVLKFLARDAVISQARRLGMAQGKMLVLDSMDDLNLVFDLLIYTAPEDRSRAIDRYARAAQLAPETDEAFVLEAMRSARFSIISSLRRHAAAGLVVKDMFRGCEYWLVDEGLESSLPVGAMLATRLYVLGDFAMTAGVLVPLDIELIEDAIADTPLMLRKVPEEAINDRRFAEAIYRSAVVSGIMEQVTYQDTIAEAS
jgi:hypothetical protein